MWDVTVILLKVNDLSHLSPHNILSSYKYVKKILMLM